MYFAYDAILFLISVYLFSSIYYIMYNHGRTLIYITLCTYNLQERLSGLLGSLGATISYSSGTVVSGEDVHNGLRHWVPCKYEIRSADGRPFIAKGNGMCL